jgi:Protein of unknown function (DUF1592)/Protein of unknown function (DUF1588)/Protein of unknown function (DUF1595)
VPAELPLRRLTQSQYVNSINALVAGVPLAAADRTAVRGAIDPLLATYPDDRLVGVPGEKHGGFHRMDQAVQQAHIDVSYALAVALGKELTSSAARRTALVGACATDTNTSNDAACLSSFLGSFGKRALRRPLTADDLTFYSAVAGSTPVDPAALADVVALLLTAPQFLYQVEEAAPAAANTRVAVDAHALASRLSLLFWQSMPDAALLAKADDGTLLQPAVLEAEAQRLLADPRSDAAVKSFFAEWFRLDELPPLDTRVGDPVFDAFAGGFVPSGTLHNEMIDEIGDLVVWLTRNGGSVRDVMLSRKAVARSDPLASLYGQPKWDGASAPTDFVEPARAGLLTRAAFVASGSANTRPIMKGFRVRNALMCAGIPPPPANAMGVVIPLSEDNTTRETVEAITEAKGSSCSGCHSTILNPIGFSTENFDALGRHRTTQKLFDAAGALRLEKPIDTRGAPFIAGVVTPVAGAEQVAALLVDGGEFQSCFARQYFRFTHQRMENDSADSCALAELQTAALEGKPLSAVLLSAALRPEFLTRPTP